MFSLSKMSANLPRHIFLGQTLSALVAFAVGYALPQPHLSFVCTARLVSIHCDSSHEDSRHKLSARSCHSLHPEQGASARHACGRNVLVPLVPAACILFVIGFAMNKLLRTNREYPKMWI
jgi:hypothetical protein